MKKVLLILSGLILGVCISQEVLAQKGQTGLGLRLSPDGAGFTGKFFVDRNVAFEVQLNAGGVFGGEGESFNAVALLEYHIQLPDPSWRVFFGGGAHAGIWDRNNKRYTSEGRYRDGTEGIFGIDGVGGVEYVFKQVPVGISADIKPSINLFSEVDFFTHNMFGVSARFYIR